MAIYLKKFETHTQYDTYINGSDAILPNVSICTTEGDVHYNPYTEPPAETRLVAKFNVTDTNSPTQIASSVNGFSSIEIDGIEQPSVTSGYTFSTTGEHTVKYMLIDPTTIDNMDFYGCSRLSSITIPSVVTSIGQYVFYNCGGLTNITLPSGLTSIGERAFSECSSLSSVTIPNGVTSIGESAFGYCYSLTSIDIPNSVTSIGDYVFQGCSGLTSCTIGSGVTSIGISVFSGCRSITSITCNAMIATTINSGTFQNINKNGTLYVPIGSSGYDAWMSTVYGFLGYYNWTKVEQ